MNLGTSLHWVSTKMKDKICLIEGSEKVSYTELWKKIELLANAFLKIGIKENDKVVLLLPNCKEFIYSFYALSRINAISVPLNPYLTSYELKKIFDDCIPKGIVTTSDLYEKKFLSSVSLRGAIATKQSQKRDRFGIDTSCQCLAMTVVLIDRHCEALFKLGRQNRLPDFSTSNNQIATINYTYRGLGKPLGAMLTHGNYHHGAIGYVRLTEVVTTQRVLLVIPISHIFTLVSCVIVPLLRGATVVIMKSFIPSHIFRAIEEHKIDFIIAVPTVYISLLRNYNKSRFDISSLKYGITGGSFLSSDTYSQIKKIMGIELLQGYGLTETMPISCNPRLKNRPESLGVPGHEVRLKIVDGEILVGGPTVMKEYYNKNGENKRFLKDGWFYTGDCGRIEEEGYIYFEGLKKDIVKIGGNNVDLKEVKDTLSSMDGVRDVELKVVEDDLWGHRIHADVRIGPKKRIDEKALRAFCSERLALYKIPREIRVI